MFRFDFFRLVNFFIKFSILGIFFLVPLLFDYVSFLNNNFILPKTLIFLILLSFLLVFTVLRIIVVKKIKFSHQLFKLYLYPALLLFVLALSSYFSKDFNQSFNGSYERLNGLSFYLALFLWLVLLIFNIYQDKKIVSIKQIFSSIALSSTLVSLYGLAQFLGLDYIRWVESPTFSRAFSTLGQPNYLGLFLLFTWPIIFYLFLQTKKNYLKALFSLALLINLSALVVSFSRGAWLAFIIANLIFGFYLIRQKNIFKLKKFLAIFLFLAVLISVISFQPIFRDRVTNFFSGATASTRVLYFQAAFTKIIKQPFLGYGLDTQENLFRDNFNKDWALYEKLSTYMDRTHNIFLDYLVVGGTLALSVFLLWLFNVFKQFRYLEKKNKKIKASQFIFMGILSALIAMQFTFETTTSYIYLWGYVGILGIIYVEQKEIIAEKKVFIFKMPSYLKYILSLALLVLFFIFFFSQLNRLSADHYFSSSVKQLHKGEYPAAILLYDYALEIRDLPKYRQEFSQEISYLFIENKLPIFIELEIKLKETSSVLGEGYRNYLSKAIIQKALKNYQSSEFLYRQAIESAPNNFRPYFELAKLYRDSERYKEAEQYYYLALNNLPSIFDNRLSLPHKPQLLYQLSLIYADLGDMQTLQGDYIEAMDFFKTSYALRENFSVLKKIADCYYVLEDYDEAVEYNIKGKELQPSDPAWSTALASLYHLQGDDDLALKELNIALNLDLDYDPAKALKKVFENK